MAQGFEDFKAFITYLAGLLGIVVTWGGLGSLIILVLTIWYTITQIRSHRAQREVAILEAKKLELEIELLEQKTNEENGTKRKI